MVYFVDDDDSIRELVIYTLNSQGIKAEGFSRPSQFWTSIEKELPDLILLDIMLPEEDGLKMLKKLRGVSATRKIPIIMLTAKGSEFDTVLGLDSGADDYIPKPFRMMEFLSRIRVHLRRIDEKEEEYRIGELCMNPSRHFVTVNGTEIILTLKEFELLSLLMENRGLVFSRAQMLDRIWGYTFDGESRTVDVHVRTLRQKLGNAGRYIETVRGVGYKFGGDTR